MWDLVAPLWLDVRWQNVGNPPNGVCVSLSRSRFLTARSLLELGHHDPDLGPVVVVAGAPCDGQRLPDRPADWAVFVVAPGDLAVGCDLELVGRRSDTFVRGWFTPAEQDRVVNAAPASGTSSSASSGRRRKGRSRCSRRGCAGTGSVEVDVVDAAGDERWARIVVRPGCRRPSRRRSTG
jgi:hypothetical protein